MNPEFAVVRVVNPCCNAYCKICVYSSHFMRLKNGRAISKMRVAGKLVAECFALLEENIKPGISLYELDQLTEKYITDRGATPLYKGYEGSDDGHPPFPGTICASINHEICHGLPDTRILKDGDIIKIFPIGAIILYEF